MKGRVPLKSQNPHTMGGKKERGKKGVVIRRGPRHGVTIKEYIAGNTLLNLDGKLMVSNK